MRLFVALELDSEIKTYLNSLIAIFKKHNAPVKFVSPEQIHLTLKFIGETNDDQVDAIISKLESAVGSCSPINCTLSGLGAFPNYFKPRVFWAGLIGETEKISMLATKINESLDEIGIEAERKIFRPHLTLGRVKGQDNLDDLIKDFSDFEIENKNVCMHNVVLYKSTLTSSGPIYQSLASFEL